IVMGDTHDGITPQLLADTARLLAKGRTRQSPDDRGRVLLVRVVGRPAKPEVAGTGSRADEWHRAQHPRGRDAGPTDLSGPPPGLGRRARDSTRLRDGLETRGSAGRPRPCLADVP